MSFRGRGRGRGRGGFGGGFRYVKEVPFELFPEIKGLDTAKYSAEDIPLVKLAMSLQMDRHLSPYYYEDQSERREKRQKVDIERYVDRKSQATKVKPPLWNVMELGTDHMPAELARGGKRRAKKIKWTAGSDWKKLEYFEELERKVEGQEGTEKKDEEEEEEEGQEEEEDDGEISDEGDYEQNEYFDDDEDDFNVADDNDDEPTY